MKKATLILTLAFGLGFFLNTAVHAINPIQCNDLMIRINSELSFEKEIALQDWMLSMEAFSKRIEHTAEQAIELQPWMYVAVTGPENTPLAAERRIEMESEIEVEAWMLGKTERIGRAVALEDWMLHITG